MMEVWRMMKEEVILFFNSEFHPESILIKRNVNIEKSRLWHVVIISY